MQGVRKHSVMMIVLLLISGFFLPTIAQAKKLNVVTSTTDMAALTQEVGGDKVNVEAIAK